MKELSAQKNLTESLFIEHKPKKKLTLSNQNAFLIKNLYAYPAFTLLLYVLSSMFIESTRTKIIVSVVFSFFPWREFFLHIYSSGYKHLRTQILVLLQVLCTSVSSGYSIEKSLELIRPVIEHTFGKKCLLIKPLTKLENNLKVHISLEKSLSEFAEEINFPETVPVFHALSISGQIGNNSLAILRSSCQMLSEMNSVQSDIQASNAGKNAEALMLCLMPFGITFALDRMSHDYIQAAKNTPTGSLLLIVAFGLCIIASALLLKYMSHQQKSIKTISSEDIVGKKAIKTPLTDIVQKILPTSLIAARHELFNELSINPRLSYEQYIKKQLLTISIGTCLALSILIYAKKSTFLVIPFIFVIYVLNTRDIKQNVILKREELMQDLPLFICLMSTLLEAGLQLPKAIAICAKAFEDNNSLSMEIKNIRALMLSGVSASDAVEKFSLRLQIPEAQSALLLIARYGRLGTSEVLNLLSLQSSSCWNLCRNAARKKQERESLGLLIPMTLDFVCVLLVATTPAIISLGI